MRSLIQILIEAASLGSLYALSALAIGLVFGIMRMINFAQGDLITLGAYALIVPSSAMVAQPLLAGLPWPLMLAGVAAVAVLAAMATERIAFRPMRGADPSTLLITSFAVSFLVQNLVLIVYGGRPKSAGILPALSSNLALGGGLSISLVQVVTAAAAAVLMVGLSIFLKRTAIGIEMRAVAEDERMARLLGVRSNRLILATFALSGLLAGAVAVLLVTQTGVLDFRMGVLLAVYAFFATVLGGMGSLPGAAVGGYLLGILSVLLQAYLPGTLRPFRDAMLFGIVVVLLLVRPQGLLAGRAARERV